MEHVSAVEAARRQREQKRAQARRKRWSRFFVTVIILASLVAIAYLTYDSSIFSVKRIEVRGTDQLSKSQVVDMSGVSLGDNIFRLELEAAHASLVANPWIRSAKLERQFPAIVRIRIRERAPVVALSSPEAIHLLDRTGFVLARRAPLTDTGLPVITDIDGRVEVGRRFRNKVLSDVLKAFLSLSEDLRGTIDTIQAPAADKLVFITREGLEIDYGKAEDIEAKNEVINRVLKEESGKIIVIDVRVVTNPTTKPEVRKLGGVPAD